MPASSLASAQAAHSLQIAGNPRLGLRNLDGIEPELVHSPRQQVGGIGPLAGEHRQIGGLDTDIPCHARKILVRQRSELGHPSASRQPFSPPAGDAFRQLEPLG
jgi:hypothetical protein